MDEERLARFQRAALEHVVPYGEERLGDRRRFGEREAVRYRQGVGLVHHAIVSVAAARRQRTDQVALVPARRAGAERGDLAGDFEARKVGGARRRRICALPLEDVGTVDAGRPDPDQDLAFARLRNRALFRLEHQRAAGLADRHCRHALRYAFRACHRSRSLPGLRVGLGRLAICLAGRRLCSLCRRRGKGRTPN